MGSVPKRYRGLTKHIGEVLRTNYDGEQKVSFLCSSSRKNELQRVGNSILEGREVGSLKELQQFHIFNEKTVNFY